MIINDNYKVESIDILNVCLFKKTIGKPKTKRAGEVIWKPIAYGKNIESMLTTMVDREINGTGIIELETVVEKINELKNDIKNLKFESEEK